MPDEQTLKEMYGLSYAMSFAPDPSIVDPKEPGKVLAWLAKSGKGTFVDLLQQDFSVTEVDWPAPSHLLPSDLLNPRVLCLFILRRLSRVVSLVRPSWGNRYFYIGRHVG